MSPQATYAGNVRPPASHSAPGGNKRDPDQSLSDGQRDALSLVFWSLVIALIFLLPVIGIALIKLSN